MQQLRKSTVALAVTLALGGLGLGVSGAQADDTETLPCAAQQAKVDKATAKLAALTAKLAEKPTKGTAKAKKAQVQRLAHATARLDACLVGEGPESES